jgi:hypothetical protein
LPRAGSRSIQETRGKEAGCRDRWRPTYNHAGCKPPAHRPFLSSMMRSKAKVQFKSPVFDGPRRVDAADVRFLASRCLFCIGWAAHFAFLASSTAFPAPNRWFSFAGWLAVVSLTRAVERRKGPRGRGIMGGRQIRPERRIAPSQFFSFLPLTSTLRVAILANIMPRHQ